MIHSSVFAVMYTVMQRTQWLHYDPLPTGRSIVVRASARGAGGQGSIPDRVTPKTYRRMPH